MIFVGMKIYGYCDGYFGRDSYEDKRIEAFGVDWIVARDESGVAWFAGFFKNKTMLEMVEKWSIPEQS